MLKKHEQHRVHDMLEAGVSVAEVAKRTGRSLGTIYKYKQLGRNIKGGAAHGGELLTPKELTPYVEVIDKGIKRKIKPRYIFFELQAGGYNDSRLIFESYYTRRKQILNPQRSIQHLETKPGEEAQVDWGHFGEITINGKREKVYLFAYILSWSRAIYLEFVVRQNHKTLQACHIHAFERLGIPKTVLYDNMKTVVSRREKLEDGTKKVHFNLAFSEFARYYQFTPQACSPHWPKHKGKIENTIKYVRNYFSRYTPRTNATLEELNEQLMRWVNEKAQQRDHRATHEKPFDRWTREKSFLTFPTNLPPYNLSPFMAHYTTQYGILNRNGNTYYLGPEYARMKLEVREIQEHGLPLLEIYHNNKPVRTVAVPAKRHSWVSVNENVAKTTKVSIPTNIAKVAPVKRQNRHDIEVEQRDPGYYSMIPRYITGVSNG